MRTVCWVLVVPAGTLGGWNQGFDGDMAPYAGPDQRGKARKVTIEVVRYVVDKARGYRDKNLRLRLKGFTKEVCEGLAMDLSRKTVEEILIANDLFKAETRRKRPRFYQSLRQRVPNGLVSIDGSEFIVFIDGKGFAYNVELSVDVGSFCHTAVSVGQSETAEEVIEVLERHRRLWGDPLGVLFDSGSANLSGKVDGYLKAHGIEKVAVGPGNPKGNGTDEGAFSQMKKTLGEIRVDASSPRALGKSILDILLRVYVRMKNRMGLWKNESTPQSKMNAGAPPAKQVEERERLAAHNKKRNAPDPNRAKVERLHFILGHHGLTPEERALRNAERCIGYYDPEAISQSEEAFLKAISRDERRRNLPYFFGILKNIQKKIDDDRRAIYCRERYNYGCMLENERRLKQQQTEDAPPTIEQIVRMAERAVTVPARSVKELAMRRAKEWIETLVGAVRYIEPLRKRIIDAVGSLSHLTLDQKEKVLNLIEEFLTPKNGEECVTLA